MVEILPSILSANFARLGDEVAALEAVGCRTFHVDVMDGHFVPNITIGPPVVESLRKATSAALDVHLMITDPDKYAPIFIQAGADHVLVHQEVCPHLDRTLHMIQDEGAKAGVVINPSTPVETLEDILDVADLVLVMSVNPGFGGQRFIPNALNKVRHLARLRKERGLHFVIEIDGGITRDNVAEVVNAGVEWVVAGSSVFHSVNPANSFEELWHTAREAGAVRV
ncbi:MAG TPA: ribulose-phosphate 3-epimerase [Bryobacteraceae bacterium]|nr:ribulose-phosphate 3-epimerase [Bryobacteraceae bacterium]